MVVNCPVLLPDGTIHRSPGELRQGILLKRGPDAYFEPVGITPHNDLGLERIMAVRDFQT